MSAAQASGAPGAASRPGRIDQAILDALAELFATVDPMPPGLPDRIDFTLAVADLDAELAWHTGTSPEPPGEPGAELPRSWSFTSPDLAILLAITPMAGTFRVDGWLAPGAPLRLELRSRQGRTAGWADEGGRFVFTGVPAGLAQLIVYPTPGSPVTLQAAVVTPAVEL